MGKLLIVVAVIVSLGLGGWLIFSRRTPTGQTVATSSLPTSGRYVDYSDQIFTQTANTRRVLYFYAAWCPTCRPADAEFKAKADQIPADVTLIRVNYDTETALKQKYAITYQHTFVQVDSQGNQVAKWSGGSLADLLANLR